MIRIPLRTISRHLPSYAFSQSRNPLIFSNGRSVFSLSQLWNGVGEKPFDYFVKDNLQVQIGKQWKLENGLFRVLFSAYLNDSSMDININHLLKSVTLNRLIQLQAIQKERIVDNPSTVIITPNLKSSEDQQENQISKNILELDKLFNDAVGLKTSYLIDGNSFENVEYIEQLKNRNKAVSADVIASGGKFQDIIFKHGYKLEHVFLEGVSRSENQPSSLFGYQYNLKAVIQVLSLIDFKGKLVLPGNERFDQAVQVISSAAKEQGYSQKLQFDLDNDNWHMLL